MKKIMTLVCLVMISSYGVWQSERTLADNGNSQIGGRLRLPIEEIEESEDSGSTTEPSSTTETSGTTDSSELSQVHPLDNSSNWNDKKKDKGSKHTNTLPKTSEKKELVPIRLGINFLILSIIILAMKRREKNEI